MHLNVSSPKATLVPPPVLTFDLSAGVFWLTGKISVMNVMPILEKSLKCFHDLNVASNIIVDFSRVQSSDSSGLALAIEWIKYTKASMEHTLHFRFFPSKLLSIAKVARLEQLLVECL